MTKRRISKKKETLLKKKRHGEKKKRVEVLLPRDPPAAFSPPPSNTILNDALRDLANGRTPAILPTKAEVQREWDALKHKTDAELSPAERKRVRDLNKLRRLLA